MSKINVNSQMIQMYTILDHQQGKLQQIAVEIGHEMKPKDAKISLGLMRSLIKAKYETNLKLINDILDSADD